MNRNRLERLRSLLAEKAYKEGHFILSSGRTSSYYLDTKLVTLDPEGLDLVADAFLDRVRRYRVDAIGGPVQGAVAIAAAVAVKSFVTGDALPAFFVRSEAKSHGTMSSVEGPVQEGARVALVDDVITSGRSVVEAIKAVNAKGLEVVVVVGLVDREEGADSLIRQYCQNYEHIFTITEVRDTVSV